MFSKASPQIHLTEFFSVDFFPILPKCLLQTSTTSGSNSYELSNNLNEVSQIFTSLEDVSHNQPIYLSKVPFISLCEHHLLPFFGTFDIFVALLTIKNLKPSFSASFIL